MTNTWQLIRYLDWPRFIHVFFFVDVSTLVIGVWAAGLRLSGTPGDSPALENLRQVALDAQHELRELLDDAIERTEQDA